MANTDTKVQQSSTKTQIELHMQANPEYLCVARAVIRQAFRVAGLAEEEYELVTLAVEEALTNVIRHSYGGPSDKPIIIKLGRIDHYDENGPALEIVIRDFGRQVDPKSIKPGRTEACRPGGRGVHIMQSVMDEVEFSRANDCGMTLRMVKRIT